MLDGTDVTNSVALPSTGGASSWGSYTVAGNAALTKGVQAMRVFVSGDSDAFHLNRGIDFFTKENGSNSPVLTVVTD